MPKKLSDTREAKIQTIDEAKAIFNSIAIVEIEIAKKKAQVENRIAKLKAKLDEEIADLTPVLERDRVDLSMFIEHHPECFRKPRNVKTSFGSFGLQKADKVQITDKEAMLEFLQEQKMVNCYELTAKPVKKGIAAALAAGIKVVGARLLKGDIAHYKVDKALLDEAKGAE